jgi:hypothetical protein
MDLGAKRWGPDRLPQMEDKEGVDSPPTRRPDEKCLNQEAVLALGRAHSLGSAFAVTSKEFTSCEEARPIGRRIFVYLVYFVRRTSTCTSSPDFR